MVGVEETEVELDHEPFVRIVEVEAEYLGDPPDAVPERVGVHAHPAAGRGDVAERVKVGAQRRHPGGALVRILSCELRNATDAQLWTLLCQLGQMVEDGMTADLSHGGHRAA